MFDWTNAFHVVITVVDGWVLCVLSQLYLLIPIISIVFIYLHTGLYISHTINGLDGKNLITYEGKFTPTKSRQDSLPVSASPDLSTGESKAAAERRFTTLIGFKQFKNRVFHRAWVEATKSNLKLQEDDVLMNHALDWTVTGTKEELERIATEVVNMLEFCGTQRRLKKYKTQLLQSIGQYCNDAPKFSINEVLLLEDYSANICATTVKAKRNIIRGWWSPTVVFIVKVQVSVLRVTDKKL